MEEVSVSEVQASLKKSLEQIARTRAELAAAMERLRLANEAQAENAARFQAAVERLFADARPVVRA